MAQQNQTASSCIQRIADIVGPTTAAALRRRDPNPAGNAALQAAVDDARDAGVSWQVIGDVLGIARGNAYRRHRRRPHPSPVGPTLL
jgi:transcriptional/translational regulatory protein YebC/TACO1